MRFVRIDPPGQWCYYEAVFEAIEKCGGRSFIEVGIGAGVLSQPLCQQGFTGLGVDFSSEAIEIARRTMTEHMQAGRYELVEDDIFNVRPNGRRYSLGLSMMVMEHVADDVGFVRQITEFVEPNGHVIVAVPGRRDRWGIEDETVGHLRRYDRNDLERVLLEAGLTDTTVWSVAVPVGNLFFRLSNLTVRASGEVNKRILSKEDQTKSSGIREIPFKTVFPAWFRLLLNRRTLYPLFVTQRLFYRTNLGLVMLGFGRRPS
ncbi:MAG TPA: class I SAM-dependent methyltransferase [Vicinamibacterales bacterium]|jgi:SAM-dependent methyltransferase